MAEKEANKVNWYPVRVLYGRAEAIRKVADEAGVEFFYPKRLVQKETPGGKIFVEVPLVRSLIFLKATIQELLAIKTLVSSSLIPYYDRQTSKPLVVPEKQMEIFMEVCGMKDSGLEYLGDDDPKYHQGDRVRVIDGIFKGFEGHIKRIRHDRKLIVTIEGVAAFATGYIPPSMLEKVE
ncbi:MAG: UpxY family transcription antiterminator [Bacteroidales bacterium]|nr:UpxY family transcription antiterminator [Bacteroidales bacterium]